MHMHMHTHMYSHTHTYTQSICANTIIVFVDVIIYIALEIYCISLYVDVIILYCIRHIALAYTYIH